MIVSSSTKKPKIHSSAYVAPSATISGDVTIGADCAVLHGAVIVSEGAPVTIGSETVVMENAVLKASGGAATSFPLVVGKRCIVGPHAYVVGATVGDGCFIASGAKVFNGATLGDGSGVALGGIVHVNTRLGKGASVPMQHVALGDPATIYSPEAVPQIEGKLNFYADVFNIEGGADVRAQAAQTYAKFLRKTHAQDKTLDEHKNVTPPPRRGEEPPPTQSADVGGVVDAMMLELQEMEHRRQEALAKQQKKK
jgi:carbonic anhydrase/acetyltransferase-like protein (isoleucine patch superfamily)